MSAAILSFDKEQFNRLFPFYILLDQDLKIAGCGSSLQKLNKGIIDGFFNQYFSISRPHVNAVDFAALLLLHNEVVMLEIFNEQRNVLRGQFEYVKDTKQILFIGSPWFNTIEQVTVSDLNLHDFAHHDPLIDLLHVLKTEEIVNDDLKQLLTTVHRQKKELKKAANEIRDIALFPMQNPDPLFRISIDGRVMMRNPAAEEITTFIYQGITYSSEDFWKFIFVRQDYANDKWVFEASFNKKIYSFICRYLPDQQYINVYGRDVTEKKQKQEQLRVLSQIAEDNINSVIITDKEGCITWVNKSFVQITGYSLEEAINKKPGHLLQGVDTNKETVAYLKQQIKNGESFNAEILNYSKTGRPYWLRIQGQPIYDQDNTLTGFFALEEDITREHEVNERIKETENQFRSALEKIGDSVWEYDFVTGKTSFSKPNYEFLGYTNDHTRDAGELWWNCVLKEDLDVLKANFEKYKLGSIDSHNIEYRIIKQDGTVKWVLDRGVVIARDEIGNPLHIIGTHTDISKIKETETELEQRVKQFKSLSENIPGVIYEYEFNADGSENIRYISPAIEQVFGIKPEEFHNYLEYISPVDRKRIIEKNEFCKNTLSPFYDESELLIPGKPGKWHAVHSSFSYISQTGSKVYTGFMMDITERKMIEEKLRINEEKYRSIIANMNLGLLEVDTHGLITYANQGFCNISGYQAAELIGQEAVALLVNDKDSSLIEEKYELRKRGVADAYEIHARDKDGNLRWWLISGAPRYNDKGELVGSIGIHLDITDQKKQKDELIEAKIQAEHLARTKEIFLANMSHEIRTPMNAILGMSNQLNKTNLDPQQQFYIDTVLSASDNLLVIINDILDLSKIEAGKLSFESIGFEPKAVIKKVMQVMALKAEEKGLRLTNSFFDDAISEVLIGDPYRLNQILLNLVSNSIKFTEKGTVNLSFSLIKNTESTQHIQVQVTDTGIGMDQEFVTHLFDKFSQENESVTRKYGGTGLGMSICKQLVELMDGSIKAESKKGKGTSISFVIELLKGKNNDLPLKEVLHLKKNFLDGRRVLVTDDNELNRLVASIILQNHGAQITEATNGQQAIDLLRKQMFDIVLMDVQMPIINGFEASHLIREAGNCVPILALTAGAIKGEREKCIEAGMNDYVAKPFKEYDLLNAIDKWLNKNIEVSEKVIEPQADEEPYFDLAELTSISKGNNEFVKKMCLMFCQHTPKLIDDMNTAYQSGNLGLMGEIAHKIKPSIFNLNIVSLKEIIRTIEKACNDDSDISSLPELLKTVERVVNRVIKMMERDILTTA